MFVPLPVLILAALLVLGLLAWALARGRADRPGDLTGPPPQAKLVSGEPPVRHGQDGMVGGISAAAVHAPDGSLIDLTDELRAELWKLVHTGHTIEAIKQVRERTGLGLREAKQVVDGLRRDDVTLR